MALTLELLLVEMSQWVHLLILEIYQWDHHPILVWADKVPAWAMVVQARGILVWEVQVQDILGWEVQAQDIQEWEAQVLATLEWEAQALDIQGWEAQVLVIQELEDRALLTQEWEDRALYPCLQKRSTHPTSQWFSILRIRTLPLSTPVVSATRKSTTMIRQSSVNLAVTSGFTASAPV